MSKDSLPIPKIEIPQIVLNKFQEDLLKELQNRSKSCSKMYSDILKLISIDFLDTKSHLVGHLMRELDSEIRESLEYKNPELLKGEQVNEIFTELKNKFKQKGFENKPKKPTKYIESICRILNAKEEYKLIKEWVLTCSYLDKLAHRDGKNLDVRPFTLIKDLWENYESILFQIMGSPYALLGIFDKHFTQDTPTNEQIVILENLLQKPTYQSYFYSNLKQINWLKPLNKAGFFNPENNPKPKPTDDGEGYYILFWSIFNYLEWVSNNLPTDDDSIVKELVKIIDKIIKYKDEDQNRIKNYQTDFSIFKILNNIPSIYIKPDHIIFIKESLETDFHSGQIGAELRHGFITKLISEDNKNILLDLIDVVCSYVKIDKDIESLIEENWFAEVVKNHKEKISKYAGKEIVDIITTKIEEIKKEDLHSFNVVWIPTIESHEQKSFPERYEAQLIDLFVECLMNLEDKKLIEKVNFLLKSDLDIFKRVGIYLVNQKFNLFKDLLFVLDYNPLEDFNLKHEIYDLLKSNANKFSEEQIKRIITWIEEKNYHLDEVEPEYKEKVLAYRKKEWYLALLSSENKDVQENYEKYNEINAEKPEHPGFVSWSTTWHGEATPLQEFELEKATVDELIAEIKEFKEEEKGFQKPTIRGFVDTIQKDVEKQPLKYSESLDKFKDINLAYLCSIIRGFINVAIKNNNENKIIIALEWGKILTFVNNQIDESFWEAKQSGEFSYKEWFISETARLIESGTKKDVTAFDTKLLPITKEILLKLTNYNVYYPANTNDYVRFTLNSTEGKILDAMLNYSLRIYRDVEKLWDEDIKRHFTKRIEEKKYLEVYTTLGQYLPQFNTLDKDWIKTQFDSIFPINNEVILNASISGLFFNTTVYSNFYSLLKEKGIYKKLLDSWQQNKRSLNKSLLRHICLGYAEKWEEIEDNTLIKDLINQPEALEEVVRFFWIIAKNMKSDYVSRVKALWNYLYENNDSSPILGKLMQWLNIFDDLDENLFNLCMKGAKFVDTRNVHYIIEYLIKFLDSKYEKVGQILLELVSNVNIVSEYKKEDVIKIVETLYLNNKKQLADNICNKYFEKQSLLFLRELYNRQNLSTNEGDQND